MVENQLETEVVGDDVFVLDFLMFIVVGGSNWYSRLFRDLDSEV